MGQRHVCETGAKNSSTAIERVKAQNNTHHKKNTLSWATRQSLVVTVVRAWHSSAQISSHGRLQNLTSTTSLFLVVHLASNRPAHQSVSSVDHKAPPTTILPSQRPSTISVGRLDAGPHGVGLDHHVSRGLDQRAARKLGVLQYSADTGQAGNLLPARIRLRQPHCTTPRC